MIRAHVIIFANAARQRKSSHAFCRRGLATGAAYLGGSPALARRLNFYGDTMREERLELAHQASKGPIEESLLQEMRLNNIESDIKSFPHDGTLEEKTKAQERLILDIGRLPREMRYFPIQRLDEEKIFPKKEAEKRLKSIDSFQAEILREIKKPANKNGANIVNNTQINIGAEAAETTPVPLSTYASWEQLGITLNGHGAPICNLDNALKVFEKKLNNLIWFDKFHGKYYTNTNFQTLKDDKKREWGDIDDLSLTTYFQRSLGLSKMTDDVVRKAAIIHAQNNQRNEPKEWMDALAWDGVERIEHFFSDCFGASDTTYTRAASSNFWVGMVSRIYKPGGQLDNMVVLEGPQGLGKTRGLRAIGGDWYTEIKESVTEKDFFLALQGKLIVEIAELDSFSKAEVTRIKQVITCAVDRYRAPYASASADHPRQCIFVGTTNENTYLKDNTGARRFWPILCSRISIESIERQRDQLFAEAVHKFLNGSSWWEMPEEGTAHEQEGRREADAWEVPINTYLIGKDEATTNDIITECLDIKISAADWMIQRRVGRIMRLLGFKYTTRKIKGDVSKVWKRVETLEI